MKAQDFFNITLAALQEQGAMSGGDIFNWVKIHGSLSDEQLTQLHKGSDTVTELEYTLGWSRTGLKNMGYLSQPQRGLWELTDKARLANCVVPADEVPPPRLPQTEPRAPKPPKAVAPVPVPSGPKTHAVKVITSSPEAGHGESVEYRAYIELEMERALDAGYELKHFSVSSDGGTCTAVLVRVTQ